MKRLFLFFSILLLFIPELSASDFQSYKLSNGLTVYLSEDHNQSSVYGAVVVRAGSIDEPAEYSGLAHYLEHVLFKGTEKIGSFDWEKEKVHYSKIISLYDEFSQTTDESKRKELEKEINEESMKASQYANTNEFSNLVQSMGGTGLNAGTSYDYTVYFNYFPAFQIEKWLDLYTERFINPVFRSFQAELENVFEEYNMYEDMNMTHIRKFIFSNLYDGHPYSREIIGSYEHLKNPRLSKLIDYYNTWYVPNNMALVLVGNFNSEEIIPVIESRFSKLQTKELPERVKYPDSDFSKNPKYSAKLGHSPMVAWGFKTVPYDHSDEYLLDFCANLLSNSMQTGLLDKITMDGEVQYAGATLDSRRDMGRFLIQAVPYFDVNQRIYESDRATERIIIQELDKLKDGTIDDWLIESVKKSLLRQYELMLESSEGKAHLLQNLFVYQLPDNYYESLMEKINSVTKEDIKQTAQKYLSANHITLSIEVGNPKKNKLPKPQIKAIDQETEGKSSEYSDYLKSLPVTASEDVYNNFDDVTQKELYEGVKLFHTPNNLNDYFTLTLKYGVGTEKMPKLKYAAQLMNSAGIMPFDDAQTVRRQFSELDASCTFNVTDDYMYINLVGSESKLIEICNLMTRLTLLPKLDEKQKDRIIGSEISYRLMTEKEDINILSNALLDYARFQDNSDYLDRMSLLDIYNLSISELTGEIIRATEFELDIHYVGKKPFDEIVKTLTENLPLKEGVKESDSPFVKEHIAYSKPTIYFLPNKDVQQAQIYFYFDGSEYSIDQEVSYNAFTEYFSGSFNGLVMQEIREKNSMAYAAAGGYVKPPVQGKNTYFLGYVGTQSDKAADAIDIYMNLLNNMPYYPERTEDIKMYLKQAYLSQKPSFRRKSQVFEDWKLLGYNDDPAKINMGKIESLKFEDITDFYEQNVKNKPVSIFIIGDSKTLNTKEIESKYGKMTRVNANRLFSRN